MMINQSDIMKNLLLKAPGDSLWNQHRQPTVMPTVNLRDTGYFVGRDTGVMPMPRIGLRPTFPFPGQSIEPGCDCTIQPDPQSAIVRLVNMLLTMAQNLINRLTNFTGFNQSNSQILGFDSTPSLTDSLPMQMDPSYVDPGFGLDPSSIQTLPLKVTPEEGSENLGTRLGNIFDGLKTGWTSMKDLFTSGKELWNSVREGWTSFKDFAKPLLGGLGSMVSSPLRGIGNLFSSGFNIIKNLF